MRVPYRAFQHESPRPTTNSDSSPRTEPGPILWLDDSPTRTRRFLVALPDARTTETADGMIAMLGALDRGAPSRAVFLDHDLGGEIFVDSGRADTGMEVVRWIAQHRPPVSRYIVHSFNPEATRAMVQVLVDAGFRAEAAPFGSAAFLDVLGGLGSPTA